jgi:hypothetical protein
MRKYSRDKEVYVRRFNEGSWSEEIQVSPNDVPNYEDHTEPAIAVYDGGAVICWSWDFHQPKGYTKQAAAPTIFVRSVNDNLQLGKPIAVSNKNIDVTPAIVVGDNKQLWCAWDSLSRKRQKTISINNIDISRGMSAGNARVLTEPAANVCSPCFAKGPGGRLTLLWSEKQGDKPWLLKRADFDGAKRQWSKAEIVKMEGNPRFCSATYDLHGRLWISYSVESEKGREIVVEKLEKVKKHVAKP